MCGIAAAFWRIRPRNAETLLSNALDALRLRGPDDRGAEFIPCNGGVLGLGHTRLAVIDLSSNAHQPMTSADGRFSMIFNGELYNYKELREDLLSKGHVFRSLSDTEVLLAAWVHWGKNCLSRLDGMFAFVVHDRQADRFTCVRDGFGIKPMFVWYDEGRFLVASTQRALVALRGEAPRVDMRRAYDYLVHGDYDSNARTFVAGVEHLPPGCSIELDLRACKASPPERWWKPRTMQGDARSFSDAADAVREQFLTNIRLQLRSDVPLGAALSGGIDSSAVVCAMRHIEPSIEINTFSYVATGSALNEERWVDQVNDHVGARSFKVSADHLDLLGDLDNLMTAQEEPFGTTSIYAQYRVFKLARESGVTVTLDGQGADELLAGYTGYPGFRLLSILQRQGPLAAHRFARTWGRWPGRSYSLALMELGRVIFPDRLYAGARKMLGRDFKPTWLDVSRFADAGVTLTEDRPGRDPENRERRVIEQLSKSLQERGLPALLRHADRNAMNFSVESRVPFLTNNLCELLLSMPEEYLIAPSGETKSVFRAAMRGIVPDAILDRKDKIGFATPERDWLMAIAPNLRQMLLDDGSAIPFLRTRPLLEQFDAIVAGRRPFTWQVWRWVNFVRWYARSEMTVSN